MRAILDTRRGPVVEQVERDFPFLPAGCTVDLDRQSREIVLDNLKAAVRRSRWQTLVVGPAAEPDGTSARRVPRSPRPPARGRLPRRSQLDATPTRRRPLDARRRRRRTRSDAASEALGRLTHLDDPERVAFYRDAARATDTASRGRLRRAAAAAADDARVGSRIGRRRARLARRRSSRRSGTRRRSASELRRAARRPRRRARERARRRRCCRPRSRSRCTRATRGRRSSRRWASARASSRRSPRAASCGCRRPQSDVFFVDLHKAERDYSPTTMYRDYAINRELFHWESQSRQTPQQPTVQRYINHQARGHARPAVRARAQDLRARDAALHVPRTGDLRRAPRRAPGRVHVAPAGADAGGAVRGRAQRRGGLMVNRG